MYPKAHAYEVFDVISLIISVFNSTGLKLFRIKLYKINVTVAEEQFLKLQVRQPEQKRSSVAGHKESFSGEHIFYSLFDPKLGFWSWNHRTAMISLLADAK